jgi:hypothetical protein
MEAVLTTYELCSEHILLVLQQAVECFDRSEHSRRLWNNRSAASLKRFGASAFILPRCLRADFS